LFKHIYLDYCNYILSAGKGSGLMISGQQPGPHQLVEMSSLLGNQSGKGPRSEGGHSVAGSSQSQGQCRAREFGREQVRLLQELGEGAFGECLQYNIMYIIHVTSTYLLSLLKTLKKIIILFFF
jgi:hypothetical protein